MRLFHKCLTAIGIRAEKYYLFQIEITPTKLITKPLMERFEAVQITRESFDNYDFSLFGKKRERFRERLNDDSVALYAVVEGVKVCYYTWISYKYFIFPRYVQQQRLLAENEAFLFDSACDDEYKGRGFHSFMNVWRLKQIYEREKNVGLVLVLDGNTPAMKVQQKSGMKITKIMKTFHCSWLKIDRVKFIDYEG